jgi:putative tryptophan/tyrosine transport system substrate-binding protein
MGSTLQRREFITLLGGAATAWPLAARAQQNNQVRRLGWLVGGVESDIYQKSAAVLVGSLAKLGWVEGHNLKVDLRYGQSDQNRIGSSAAELIALAPDVILASQTVAARALQQRTHTIPIVITAGGDLVANGFVKSIARPEGNITGFATVEPAIASKWLELLKEAAPGLARVAVVYNPELIGLGVGPLFISSIETAAATLGLRTITIPFRDAIQLVRAVDNFAAEPDGSLIRLPPQTIFDETIFKLAVQHRLPAMYPLRSDVAAGGLISYSPDQGDLYQRAASYVDRLLRGAKVSDLPVQFPTKYELVINLRTAKAMGLTLPEAFLIRADGLIE